MRNASYHILRVGMAITFLWIGILILKSPEAWGGFLQPWALNLLPISLRDAMIQTAVMDIAIGILLLFDIGIWLAAIVAAFHLITVLVVSGINDVTVRDIALLAGTIALAASSPWPAVITKFFRRLAAKRR